MAGTQNPRIDVAVLGTGIMGSAMARNLVAAGLRTTVWDRSLSATAPLSKAGALAAASPDEAVTDARVVITMLPTAEVVNSVIFDGGVVMAFAEGAVWAQMGTIGGTAITQIAGRLGRLRPGVMFVDAPVSGSKGPAEARAVAHPGLRRDRGAGGSGPGVLRDRTLITTQFKQSAAQTLGTYRRYDGCTRCASAEVPWWASANGVRRTEEFAKLYELIPVCLR